MQTLEERGDREGVGPGEYQGYLRRFRGEWKRRVGGEEEEATKSDAMRLSACD